MEADEREEDIRHLIPTYSRNFGDPLSVSVY